MSITPLTPPDCDVRGLPYMPLDVVTLVDSDLVALSTGDEFKAAVILWCKAWQQFPAASLPDDDKVLAHLSGAGSKWKKVRAGAMRGFVHCSDGRWYHPVIAKKAIDAWRGRLAQRERAAKRWQSHGNATASQTPDATAYATAMPVKGKCKGKLEEEDPSHLRNVVVLGRAQA